MKWENARKDIKSISSSEKNAIDLIAELVGAITSQREKLGMTQGELAELSGISVATLDQIESGSIIPQIDMLLRLVIELGLKVIVIPDEQAAALAV